MMYLFLILINVFSQCKVELHHAEIISKEWYNEHNYSTKLSAYGTMVIDGVKYDKAYIDHRILKVFGSGYKQYAFIYFGVDKEEDTVKQIGRTCENKSVSYIEEIEKTLECACEYSKFYYRLDDAIRWYGRNNKHWRRW